MVKKLLPCLAFICVLGLATCLSAQDDSKETSKPTAKQTKKEKAKQKKIDQYSKRISREFKGVELSEDQQKKLAELVEPQVESLNDINKQVQGIIKKESRKSINEDVKKARSEGKSWPDASKVAWDNAGISAEDQTKLKDLNKQRNDIFASVKKEIVTTFTDDQKKAFQSKKKGKGKGKKDKGKKKKKETDDETSSVSISLPGMT